ncbi:hexose transporter Hxt13p [Trichomonascus vanleenenianus]|uniref:sugar porter family MFS transporter n=1 Tax=Trichomonascus vanleenenianus TaxID=2268995 RepID=UPI003ECB487E
MFGRSKYSEGKTSYLGVRGKWLHHVVATVAGCGFLLFGYDQGVMGGLLTLDSFKAQFPAMNAESGNNYEATVQGTCISIYEIGCMMGALSTMYFGDKFGRRKMIFTGSIIMTIGAILQFSSFQLAQLIIGRVVTGVGNGLITATVPSYQAECAKPEVRGKLVMVEGALITCGIMISYWVDYGFSFITDSSISWRFPIAFQIVFAIFIFVFVLSLPESPRWLVKKNRIEEARMVFACFEDAEIDAPVVTKQMDDVMSSLVEEGKTHASLKRLFTMDEKKHFHRLNLAFWIQCFQQITGINLITYYAATVYQNSIGMSGDMARLLAALNGTEYFIASWIAFYTIERFGRRKLMLFGAAGQAITMGILTATVWDGVVNNNNASGITAAVFLFVFNTFFAIGWLGMTWLYPAEIVSLEIRAPANGISTASNWIFNFLVVMITPIAFNNIKHFTYTIFAVINALIFVATYFLFPETAGRTLEEIDLIFEHANPKTPWDVVRIADKLPRRDRDELEALRSQSGHPGEHHVMNTEKAHYETVENDPSSSTNSL